MNMMFEVGGVTYCGDGNNSVDGITLSQNEAVGLVLIVDNNNIIQNYDEFEQYMAKPYNTHTVVCNPVSNPPELLLRWGIVGEYSHGEYSVDNDIVWNSTNNKFGSGYIIAIVENTHKIMIDPGE